MTLADLLYLVSILLLVLILGVPVAARLVDRDGDKSAAAGRFVPSLLDRSVRIAHGSSQDTSAQELADVEERALEQDEPR